MKRWRYFLGGGIAWGVLSGATLALAQPAPAAPPPAAAPAPAPAAPAAAPPPGTAPAPSPDGPAPGAPAQPAPGAPAQPAPGASQAAAPSAAAPTVAPTAAPAPAPAESAPVGPKAPPPSTGFQMGFRLGLAFPLGSATDAPSDSLAARYAWQVPLGLEAGVKIVPNIFLGGYFSYAFGAEGSDPFVEALCDDNDDDLENDIDCEASTLRLGLEVQYHFAPGEKMNPWIGYGAGYETSDQTITDRQHGYSERSVASGFTVAKLDAGLDLRSKVVGAGPYIEAAIGQFTSAKTEIGSTETASGDIPDTAWHAWLAVGFRMVVFP